MSALLRDFQRPDGPWRTLLTRSDVPSAEQAAGREHLVHHAWSMHRAPLTDVTEPHPLRSVPHAAEHDGPHLDRIAVASPLAVLDLSWLVWSCSCADLEGRLGGIRPDPVQVLAFRFASIVHDPHINFDRLDADNPTDLENHLAGLEYDALNRAAHYCDLGMATVDQFLPDTVLSTARGCHDPVPAYRYGTNRPDGTVDPLDAETWVRASRVLVHEHRRNEIHLPDHSDVQGWAHARGTRQCEGGDVHSVEQRGGGVLPWAEPAIRDTSLFDSAPLSAGVPGVAVHGGSSSRGPWPWNTTSLRLMVGDYFTPAERCTFCGLWLVRGPCARSCLACQRLATPWSVETSPADPDTAPPPQHPLDLLPIGALFPLVRAGARYAPIPEHLCPRPRLPGPTDYTASWLLGELLGAWRHMAVLEGPWAVGPDSCPGLTDEPTVRAMVATLARLCAAPPSWALDACCTMRNSCPVPCRRHDHSLAAWFPAALMDTVLANPHPAPDDGPGGPITVRVGGDVVVIHTGDDFEWLRAEIGGDHLSVAVCANGMLDAEAPDPDIAAAADVQRGALASAARASGRAIHSLLGCGSPLGRLVVAAITRRLRRARAPLSPGTSTRPADTDRDPVDIPVDDEPDGSVLARRPARELDRHELARAMALVDEIRRVRHLVALDAVPREMQWSSLLVPLIWHTATDRGCAILCHALRCVQIDTAIIDFAAAWWNSQGVHTYQEAHEVIIAAARGMTLHAPNVGGYMVRPLQEHMMDEIDPDRSLQESVLSGDREAVEAGRRARTEREGRAVPPARGGRPNAEPPPGAHTGGADPARTGPAAWHADLLRILGRAHDVRAGAGRPAPGNTRERYLDNTIRDLDARQRQREGRGPPILVVPDESSSLNGDQAQELAHQLLTAAQPGLDPGPWISSAIWLCLAPHYFPLLRPLLAVRGLDSRPYDVLYRWLPMAGVHGPADLVRFLRPQMSPQDASQTVSSVPAPGPYGPVSVDDLRHLLERVGPEACLTHTEAMIATGVLVECLGDGLTRISPPPGDAARLPGEDGDPVEVPDWTPRYTQTTCSVCMADLDGSTEVLIPCGHPCHAACLRQWRASQPSVHYAGGRSGPSSCPQCREFDRGSVPVATPGGSHQGPHSAASTGTTLLLRDGTLPALRPAIRMPELSDAVRHHASSLDCLRAQLFTVRRPHTYLTLADMRLLHQRVQSTRALQPPGPAPMSVDGEPPSGDPPNAAGSDDRPRMPAPVTMAEPPTHSDRLRQVPRIPFQRWSLLLGRHPPDASAGRGHPGPPPFPVALLTAAIREVSADLVITRRSLVGTRLADEVGVAFSFASPDTWTQVTALVHQPTDSAAGGRIPIILIVDASASHMDSALHAAALAGGPCCIIALTAWGVPTPGGPDPIELATMANFKWGWRAASHITHLVPVGSPFRTGRASPPLQQLLAAQFDLSGRLLRTRLPPFMVVHWGGHRGDTTDALHILVPGRHNDAVLAMVMRWESDLGGDTGRPAMTTTDWTTTKVLVPADELLSAPGLDTLYHHVVRCRAARPGAPGVHPTEPLDQLQALAQVITLSCTLACTWRARETSDSVHVPLPTKAICLGHSIAAVAAASVGHRVGICGTGLLLLRTPERVAAPILRHLREELPQVLGADSKQPAVVPRRILLDGPWDGGPSSVRLVDPEEGFHLRWNLADLAQSCPRAVLEAVEATTGPDTVEQVSTVYALFPDTSEYQHMTQVRLRLSAADAMSAAFSGTSCIAVGSQIIRIFHATTSRDPLRRHPGPSAEEQAHVASLALAATREAPRRAAHPQILEVTGLDRHGTALGTPLPRGMRSDSWVPGHSALGLYSTYLGSTRTRLCTRLWPLPAGPDGRMSPSTARAAPPDVTPDWIEAVSGAMDTAAPSARCEVADRRPGLRDYDAVLHPGEYLVVALAAGGALTVTTSGEVGFLYTSVPTWATVVLPAEAELRAAQRGAARPQARVQLQLVSGSVHLARPTSAPPEIPTPDSLGLHINTPDPRPLPRRTTATLDPVPGPARPPQFPGLAEVLLRTCRPSAAPPGDLVRADDDALHVAQGMLGRYQACISEQHVHDLARGVQARLAIELRRESEGRPILRYNWDMFGAIWLLQLTGPAHLERDHVFQLLCELGIREEATRQLPFSQWLAPEPDITYTAHHAWLDVPGARGETNASTTHVLVDDIDARLDVLGARLRAAQDRDRHRPDPSRAARRRRPPQDPDASATAFGGPSHAGVTRSRSRNGREAPTATPASSGARGSGDTVPLTPPAAPAARGPTAAAPTPLSGGAVALTQPTAQASTQGVAGGSPPVASRPAADGGSSVMDVDTGPRAGALSPVPAGTPLLASVVPPVAPAPTSFAPGTVAVGPRGPQGPQAVLSPQHATPGADAPAQPPSLEAERLAGPPVVGSPWTAARGAAATLAVSPRTRPPPDSAPRSATDPLGRGDEPRPSAVLPPCMRADWLRELGALDATLSDLATLDNTGHNQLLEARWTQAHSVVAWGTALPQLTGPLRRLFTRRRLPDIVLDAFGAFWDSRPPPGTRNAGGRRISSRTAATSIDAACAQLQSLVRDGTIASLPAGSGLLDPPAVPFQTLTRDMLTTMLRLGAGPPYTSDRLRNLDAGILAAWRPAPASASAAGTTAPGPSPQTQADAGDGAPHLAARASDSGAAEGPAETRTPRGTARARTARGPRSEARAAVPSREPQPVRLGRICHRRPAAASNPGTGRGRRRSSAPGLPAPGTARGRGTPRGSGPPGNCSLADLWTGAARANSTTAAVVARSSRGTTRSAPDTHNGDRPGTRRSRIRLSDSFEDATAAPHPTDLLQTIWANHRDPATGLSPLVPADPVLAVYRSAGLTDAHILAAAQTLHSQGLLSPGDAAPGWTPTSLLRLHRPDAPGVGVQDFTDQDGVLARHPDAFPAEPPGPGPGIHLVTLFSDWGLGRLALGDLLRRLHVSARFRSSAFVEPGDELAATLEGRWDPTRALAADGGPAHRRLAAAPQDLFRDTGDGTPWERHVRSLDSSSCLLLLADPPQTNLVPTGPFGGLDGLAGMESADFFALPVAWEQAVRLRPDLRILVCSTAVASAHPSHRTVMCTALGDLPPSWAARMDAGVFVPSPRDRTWFSNVHPDDSALAYPRLPCPWEPGWTFRPDGRIPTWLPALPTGAPSDPVLPCLWQTHLRCLLYDTGSPHRWLLRPLPDAKKCAQQLLEAAEANLRFPGCVEGLGLVMQGRERESLATERKVRAWATWLVQEGRAHGLRLPTSDERARAVGLGAYFASLSLGGRDLYDAIGGHQDPRNLQQRVLPGVLAWLRGEGPSGPPPSALCPYPTLRHIQEAWRAATAFATAQCPWARVRRLPFDREILLAGGFDLASPQPP